MPFFPPWFFSNLLGYSNIKNVETIKRKQTQTKEDIKFLHEIKFSLVCRYFIYILHLIIIVYSFLLDNYKSTMFYWKNVHLINKLLMTKQGTHWEIFSNC